MNVTAEQVLTVTAPASKSLSHRYCIGAALSSGQSTLRHVLNSADLARTRDILEAVGARFTPLPEEDAWQVEGLGRAPQGGQGKALACNVGESGTTCRLLTAVLAAGQGLFRIHGEGRMHERPLGDLCQALTELGAGIVYEEKAHCPPLLLQAGGLNPHKVDGVSCIGMDHSSQFFSGLLLAAPLASAPLSIELGGARAVSWPYVGLTLQCLEDFGIRFSVESRRKGRGSDSPWQTLSPAEWRRLDEAQPGCLRVCVTPGAYRGGNFCVEGDWSAASYFLAAGALGQRPVRVRGLRADSLQGDRAMLDILVRMGARFELEDDAVTVFPSTLHGVSLDMGACPDLVPTVAVLATYATGSTRISNVAHLRIKESDRINAPACELAKLGVMVDQLSDGMLINGTGGLAGHEHGRLHTPRLPEGTMLSTHNDHRMAMSLALLELRDPNLHVCDRLDDPSVVRKSFPQFWDVWSHLL